MSYIVLLATGPTTETFLPFTDNVADVSYPGVCGPVVYSVDIGAA